MKISVTADIHFSSYAQDSTVGDLPERLNSLYNALNNIVIDSKARGIDHMCIAGDLLHNKSIIYTIAQDRMLEFFDTHRHDMTFYVIDGNHDLSGKGSDSVSALKSLASFGNVRWISHQSKGEIHHAENNIVFMPYFPGMQDHIKGLKGKGDIFISHFGLSEGMLNSGISIQSSIKASDLKFFKLVVLGHYHLPQFMVTGSTHLYYAGSPIQLDNKEKNEKKRFLIIDTDDPHKVESVPTRGYKEFIELTIDPEDRDKCIQQAITLKEEGHHVTIVTQEKLELTEDMKGLNIKSEVQEDITNRGITSDMTDIDIHSKYLEIKGISEEERTLYLETAKLIMDSTELPE